MLPLNFGPKPEAGIASLLPSCQDANLCTCVDVTDFCCSPCEAEACTVCVMCRKESECFVRSFTHGGLLLWLHSQPSFLTSRWQCCCYSCSRCTCYEMYYHVVVGGGGFVVVIVTVVVAVEFPCCMSVVNLRAPKPMSARRGIT